MVQLLHQVWLTPDRLTPAGAKLVLGLAVAVLGLAGLGFFLYDGWHRVSYVSAFGLIVVGNVLLALGSLLPDERGGRVARLAARPVTGLMLVALAAALAFQLGIWR
ncbi:MAG: hypothetical protein M3464_00995 [Chloroflexota bacterium]|nr:hypothetical protein [Chloroflexota bacterium]